MELEQVLNLLSKKHPDNKDGCHAILIYADGSGMIVQLGSENINTPIYEVPKQADFNEVSELIEHLQREK